MDGSQEKGATKPRTESVDLDADHSLQIEISDALSEQEKVKFTIHTKTTLKTFKKSDFSVVREHEEFVWLHDRYVENEDYAGILIPPPPPKPDFDDPRAKLTRLREGEDGMSKEQYTKMKQELEAEYLAIFKKTVAMHEVFLQRLAAHPSLREDHTFKVFLEFADELSAKQKNTRERLGSMFKYLGKSFDERVILRDKKHDDDFFEKEKNYLTVYNTQLKETANATYRMTRIHKRMADSYIRVATGLADVTLGPSDRNAQVYRKAADTLEKLRKHEGRVATDEDLKLTDLLRYYERDTQAALDLMYRRLRSLVDLGNATKALDKAKLKGKDVATAESNHEKAESRVKTYSTLGKTELETFKGRRVVAFRKNMVALAELQIKHARTQINVLSTALSSLRAM